jgi:hypothetical protein
MVMLMSIRTYSELILLPTFEERFRYLNLNGKVGEDTFGHDRYLNQLFYTSDEWRRIRRDVIVRDNGCDLGIWDREIQGLITIHHLNPITVDDILNRSEFLLNPEYLICVSDITHKAIHYGDESLLITAPIERRPNDTCPWRR